MDRMCQGGFEIRKEGGLKWLRVTLGVRFDAWPERPLLGDGGLVCEARWEIEGIGDGQVSCPAVYDNEWVREVQINKNLGLPQPADDCFGPKRLNLIFDLRQGDKLLARVPVEADLLVFFEKGQHSPGAELSGWVDYDGNWEPNWFEYWKVHGCVHPDMGRYVYREGDWSEGGHFDRQTGELVLAGKAADVILSYSIVHPTTGEAILDFPTKRGVDFCAEVVEHELTHEWVHNNWITGEWDPMADPEEYDSDDDGLPDFFEIEVTHTDPDKRDTYNLKDLFGAAIYGEIGDQEFYCRMMARDTHALDPSNDWAYPGKQTQPPF